MSADFLEDLHLLQSEEAFSLIGVWTALSWITFILFVLFKHRVVFPDPEPDYGVHVDANVAANANSILDQLHQKMIEIRSKRNEENGDK